MVLPMSIPARVGLLAGICCTKSQSPRYSPKLGGGGASQMTSALCLLFLLFFWLNILVNNFSIILAPDHRFLTLVLNSTNVFCVRIQPHGSGGVRTSDH